MSYYLVPPEWYYCDYDFLDYRINQAVAILKQKNGFRLYKEEVYPAYSLTQLHLNHLIA